MYHTILVPLDGSSLAECALPNAERLARAAGARMLLVRATTARGVPGGDPAEAQARAVRQAESYLAEIADQLGGPGVVETAVFYGDPAEAILTEVNLRHADLVVMATHSRVGLDRLVYGSVAEAIMSHSPVPVLLVRAGLPAPGSFGDQPRILVPLDGSAFAEEALAVARELAERIGGELLLVQSVVPPLHGQTTPDGRIISTVDQELAALRADVHDYLQHVAQRLAADTDGRPISIEVRVGPPVETIVEAAREREAAIVVMATHGRTGLARLLLGSVAAGVVHAGDRAVVLVRPEAIRPTAGASGPEAASVS